jgi:DNA-binding LacI/PurR family transcriptional regulator
MGTLEKRQSNSYTNGGTDRKKRPLYRSITDTLRRQLMEGNLVAGARMPALRELAKQFNVSTITVRQALRSLEQEGHLHCIPGVGTFVRPNLPNRASTEQITVAFATIDIEGAFTSGVAHNVEQACQQRGWIMQILNAQDNSDIEARNLSRIARSGVSGAIILPVGKSENLEELFKLKITKFPFVLVDRVIPGLKVDVVASDHQKGAYLATEHLLKRGHRQIVMVSEPITPTPVQARVRGYEQALMDYGLTPLPEWKTCFVDDETRRLGRDTQRWQGGYEAAMPVLTKLKPPIAVFAHNSYSGWGVSEACRKMGLNVPKDVSIICFDDSEFTRALSPPMSAIAQRTDEIGAKAVELLEQRLVSNNTNEPQQILIDVDLVERESVATITG